MVAAILAKKRNYSFSTHNTFVLKVGKTQKELEVRTPKAAALLLQEPLNYRTDPKSPSDGPSVSTARRP